MVTRIIDVICIVHSDEHQILFPDPCSFALMDAPFVAIDAADAADERGVGQKIKRTSDWCGVLTYRERSGWRRGVSGSASGNRLRGS